MKESIQEQLIAARRNQILDAATKVFAKKGFHPTTIRDIAREAGIADGTIYNYFENKTALILGILDRMNESEQREADLSQSLGSDFRGFMRTYLQHRLTVMKDDSFAVFQVILSEILVNKELRELYYQKIIEPTFALAEKYLQEWAAQHLLQPTNVGLTIRAISATALGMMVLYVLGDEQLQAQWDEIPDLLTNMILDGIGIDKN